MGQKDGEKWTAAVDSQPTLPKPDRLLVLQCQVRLSDRVGRWCGEELLVVAPATTKWAAADGAERIRQCVADWPFAHHQQVTISLGVTQVLPGDGVDTLLQRTDLALYRAKQRGRNCVEHQLEAERPRRLERDSGVLPSPQAGAAQSKGGSNSVRSAPRLLSKSGSTERTTSQNAELWFISRRWASSWVTT